MNKVWGRGVRGWSVQRCGLTDCGFGGNIAGRFGAGVTGEGKWVLKQGSLRALNVPPREKKQLCQVPRTAEVRDPSVRTLLVNGEVTLLAEE